MPPRKPPTTSASSGDGPGMPGDSLSRLTVSIYQNAEHVSGILQQAYGAPLLTEESRENLLEQKDEAGRTKDAGGNVGVKAKAPVVGDISGDIRLGRSSREDTLVTQAGKSIQQFIYSQAYYLHVVRNTLRGRDQLKSVRSVTDAEGLLSGDFVEYQAAFRPNEINAALDILTPRLVAAIATHLVRREALDQYMKAPDTETIQRLTMVFEAKARSHSELAEAIAEAVRVDFRSEKTREYYGLIGEGGNSVTAITICDAAHFVVEDEDRILDGRFTVLGKVTSSPEIDVPVLGRNKLLERFEPKAVDEVFDRVRAVGASPATGGMFDTVGDMIDLELASRIYGTSFKVVPIAIYA
jgi:hypothetical protein